MNDQHRDKKAALPKKKKSFKIWIFALSQYGSVKHSRYFEASTITCLLALFSTSQVKREFSLLLPHHLFPFSPPLHLLSHFPYFSALSCLLSFFCIPHPLHLHIGHVMQFCSLNNTTAVHSGSLRTVTEKVRKPLTMDRAPSLQSRPVCLGNGGWNNSRLQQGNMAKVLIKKTQMWDSWRCLCK